MLIITGLGRCGTSCIANYCHLVGYNVGGKWNESINAGRELSEVVAINHQIFDNYKNRKEDKKLIDRIKNIDRSVVKDPRFTWDCPAILKTWLCCRSDIKFIICHRNFECLCKSRVKVNSSSLKTAEECRNTFMKFMERILNYNVPFRTLTFPDFIYEFDKVHNFLTDFGGLQIDYNIGKLIWDRWVDHDKIHF